MASGKISGVGVWINFILRSFRSFCYKMDETTAYLGDVKFAYPHEDKDQWIVKNVVGGCTLWNEMNLRAT